MSATEVVVLTRSGRRKPGRCRPPNYRRGRHAGTMTCFRYAEGLIHAATDPVVTFLLVLGIGIIAGVLFDRLAGPSWLARQFSGSTRGIVTSALVGVAGASHCLHSVAGWCPRSLRRRPVPLWCYSRRGWPSKARHSLARFASGTGPAPSRERLVVTDIRAQQQRLYPVEREFKSREVPCIPVKHAVFAGRQRPDVPIAIEHCESSPCLRTRRVCSSAPAAAL